ncbi:MAG: hypothetical protein D6797_07980 [Bdellovibrio sp.]|nr:MAG: hypothetical protein D6797_07980 [Bdellovibrio sp.]
MQKIKNIIWALDPFSENNGSFERVKETVAVLQKKSRCEVQPVYVLGSDNLEWIGHVMPPQLEKFKEISLTQLKLLVEKTGIPTKEPVVITNSKSSRRADVAQLMEFVEGQNGDLLVMNTHAREGVSRLFIGSFAESVLTKSTVPLLLVNPHVQPVKDLEVALFSTDFSKFSQKALGYFVSQMQGFLKKLILFNEIPHPIDAFVQAGVATAGGGWVSVEQFIQEESEERKKMAEKMVAAIPNEVETEIEIDDSPGPIVESVLRVARQKSVHWLALSAESGDFSSFTLGSIARSIIRHSEWPVWVDYRPE